jgi:hypothetical protein
MTTTVAISPATRRSPESAAAARPSRRRPAHDGAALADQDSSFAVLHGLYRLCADLAERRPLCVVVTTRAGPMRRRWGS